MGFVASATLFDHFCTTSPSRATTQPAPTAPIRNHHPPYIPRVRPLPSNERTKCYYSMQCLSCPIHLVPALSNPVLYYTLSKSYRTVLRPRQPEVCPGRRGVPRRPGQQRPACIPGAAAGRPTGRRPRPRIPALRRAGEAPAFACLAPAVCVARLASAAARFVRAAGAAGAAPAPAHVGFRLWPNPANKRAILWNAAELAAAGADRLPLSWAAQSTAA